MTINKSQGQIVSYVGLFLPKFVFSHEQFYVVIFRVTSRKELRILIYDKDSEIYHCNENVVYKRCFKTYKLFINNLF